MTRFTPEEVENKYGLTPAQYPDFAALRGDPSDNLPSVPKVGEKTATKWISQYGSLEGLIDNADELKGVAANNFRERIDQVRLNRELTQMVTDVELPVAPNDLELKPADVTQVAARFDDLEFGVNLRERVLAAVPTDGAAPVQETVELEDVTIDDEPLDTWLKPRQADGLAVYVSGNATPGQGDVVALAIVDKQRHGVSKLAADLSAEEDAALKQWLESDAPKFMHEAKAAYHMLRGLSLIHI